MVNKFILSISEFYQLPVRYFKVVDGMDKNIVDFFSNSWVYEQLKKAKVEVLVAEKDYKEAISTFANFVGTHFSKDDDLSVVRSYAEMWAELQSYIRGDDATVAAKRISSKLEKLLVGFKSELIDAEMSPMVYGSVRYGDAGKNSDIDMKLLVNDVGTEQRRVYERLDLGINSVLGKTNPWQDDLDFEESIINVTELRSVITDIIDKEVNCISDYQFNGNDFYPYNWILESVYPVAGLGKIEADVNELKSMIEEAVKVDPLFELMMSLRLHRSISRRKDKL